MERAKFQLEKDNFKELITNTNNEQTVLKEVPYLSITKHLKIDGTEFNKAST